MFSNSTKYAIRTVLFLSRHRADGEKMRVQEIAAELDIPKAYLSKILQQLSKSNLVSSSKGRGGGFYLTNENVNHRLLDVVICIEGHDVFNKCILGLPNCGEVNPCHLHKNYSEFKAGLQQIIRDVSIQELMKEDLLNNYKL